MKLLRDEHGATMVEYVLMVSLVAIVAMVAVSTFGHNVSTEFNRVATTV